MIQALFLLLRNVGWRVYLGLGIAVVAGLLAWSVNHAYNQAAKTKELEEKLDQMITRNNNLSQDLQNQAVEADKRIKAYDQKILQYNSDNQKTRIALAKDPSHNCNISPNRLQIIATIAAGNHPAAR